MFQDLLAPSFPVQIWIMVTITLPPSLEKALIEQAKKVGTSPELLALETLSKCFPGGENPSAPKNGETMRDFFGDFVGCFDSGIL